MHDAMADRDAGRASASSRSQAPRGPHRRRRRPARLRRRSARSIRIVAVGAVARSRGRVPMPSIWPLISRSRLAVAVDREDLELDARRAGIDDEDRVHGVTPPAARVERRRASA